MSIVSLPVAAPSLWSAPCAARNTIGPAQSSAAMRRSPPQCEKRAEQSLHRRRQASAVVEIADLANGVGLGRIRMDDVGERAEPRLRLHRQGDLADHVARV